MELIKDFILVHNSSSYGSVDLNLKNDLPAIFVEKKSDIFQNMFLYRSLILEQKKYTVSTVVFTFS